jgi:hypothetical protein
MGTWYALAVLSAAGDRSPAPPAQSEPSVHLELEGSERVPHMDCSRKRRFPMEQRPIGRFRGIGTTRGPLPPEGVCLIQPPPGRLLNCAPQAEIVLEGLDRELPRDVACPRMR